MPEALERKLKAQARKKFPGNKKRQDRYVYGSPPMQKYLKKKKPKSKKK